MKFMQLVKKNSSFKNIAVDPETFAEIRSETLRNYVFNLRFRVAINKQNLSSVIVVTVKEKEKKNATTGLTSSSSKIKTTTSGQKDNLQVASSIAKSEIEMSDPGKSVLDGMSQKLKTKYLSGLKTNQDYSKKEDYIDRVEVQPRMPFSQQQGNKYVFTSMSISKTKNKFNRPQKNLGVSATDSIERINAELKLPMQCVVSNETKDINSALDKVYNRNFLTDYAQYFIEKVPPASNENDYPWYETTKQTRDIDFVEMVCTVSIDKKINREVIVKFDLKDDLTNLIIESTTYNLPVDKHVESFKCLTLSPNVFFQKTTKNSNSYVIKAENREPAGYVSAFNFYAKEIDKYGNSTSYVSIGSRNITQELSVKYTPSEPLAIVRVVPVNYLGKETSVHSDVVIGPGHSAIGPLTIIVNNSVDSNVIEVHNISRLAKHLQLFRRNCSENPQSSFSGLQAQTIPSKFAGGVTFIDKSNLKNGSVYEYYVVATASAALSQLIPQKFKQISNFVMQKYVVPSTETNSTQVSISNSTANTSGNETTISFNVNTSLSQKENEKITESIKTQITEFYGKYLDPVNNDVFPLGDSADGVPKYKDLIMHEVIRTNLNTAVREVFPMITDGLFIDNEATRKVGNISDLNPMYDYVYQVFTYKRNPIELFKKFAAKGTDKIGKQWFYSPYKWKNPSAQSGVLYPDDKEGIPIIETYDSLTSDSLGTTVVHKVSGAGQYTTLKDVSASRIDVNTVKVTWGTTGPFSLYDSFIVMKVINGVRYLLGSSRTNYIYHELTSIDIGDVYYIVLPIMFDYDMDEPGYTNHIVVSPTGLTPFTISVSINEDASDQKSKSK